MYGIASLLFYDWGRNATQDEYNPSRHRYPACSNSTIIQTWTLKTCSKPHVRTVFASCSASVARYALYFVCQRPDTSV